jgi:hypothetical protein
VTVTPTSGHTVTTSVAAVETRLLTGPFKLSSGPNRDDYPPSWLEASDDTPVSFSPQPNCHRSEFALDGTTLVTRSGDEPDWDRVANVVDRRSRPSETLDGASPVFFSPGLGGSSIESTTLMPISCRIGTSADVTSGSLAAACPLVCSVGEESGVFSQRNGTLFWEMRTVRNEGLDVYVFSG